MSEVVLEINGQNVAFPSMEAAQAYLASQGDSAPESASGGGFLQGLRDFVVGDDDPNNLTSGERLAELLNAGGEALTFGLVGDEAAAGMDVALGRGSYEDRLEHRRGQEDLAREEMPGAYLASQLSGGLMGAFIPGLGAMGAYSRGAGLSRNVASAVGTGAGMGATYGFMEGEGGADERLDELRQGALLGGVVGAATLPIGAGIQRAADAMASRRAIRQAASGAPSTDEMRAIAQSLYRQVDDADVGIRPESFGRFVDDLDERLTAEGLDRLPGPGSLTPRSARVMEIARAMAGDMAEAGAEEGVEGVTLPFRALDQVRRHAGTAAAQVTPETRTDARLGALTIEALDDYVSRMGADDVSAGDIRTLQDVLPRAREMWSRMSRSQLVDDAIDAAEDYPSGPTSGLRNQFRRILRNPRLSRGFSDSELDVMRRVAQGSIPERIIYNLGSGLGQVGIPITGGAIGIAGGLPGVLAGTLSGAALSGGVSRIGEGMARRGADTARAAIASGQLPSQLPVASEATRRIIEALSLRSGATLPQ